MLYAIISDKFLRWRPGGGIGDGPRPILLTRIASKLAQLCGSPSNGKARRVLLVPSRAGPLSAFRSKGRDGGRSARPEHHVQQDAAAAIRVMVSKMSARSIFRQRFGKRHVPPSAHVAGVDDRAAKAKCRAIVLRCA